MYVSKIYTSIYGLNADRCIHGDVTEFNWQIQRGYNKYQEVDKLKRNMFYKGTNAVCFTLT